jgi:hypothetical protein
VAVAISSILPIFVRVSLRIHTSMYSIVMVLLSTVLMRATRLPARLLDVARRTGAQAKKEMSLSQSIPNSNLLEFRIFERERKGMARLCPLSYNTDTANRTV